MLINKPSERLFSRNENRTQNTWRYLRGYQIHGICMWTVDRDDGVLRGLFGFICFIHLFP